MSIRMLKAPIAIFFQARPSQCCWDTKEATGCETDELPGRSLASPLGRREEFLVVSISSKDRPLSADCRSESGLGVLFG